MKLKEKMILQGYDNLREIDGIGLCGTQRMLFTTGLFIGLRSYEYRGRYCFHTMKEATDALSKWDGKDDPHGNWIKYKGSPTERSNPNYVDFSRVGGIK